jgi:CHAD domain-containing protein
MGARLADVRRCAEQLEKAESDDAVHDMRVAARRLRATLDLFEAGSGFRAGKVVKRLQDALGRVRDAQVQLHYLEHQRADPAVVFLRTLLQRELDQRRRELRKAMKRWRGKDAFKVTLGLGRPGKGKMGGHRARAHLRRRLQQWRARLVASLPELGMMEAHRLRITTKKLRYELELLEPGLPRVGAKLRTLLAEVQDDLGVLHDVDVQLDNLAMVKVLEPRRAAAPSLEAALTEARRRGATRARRRLERLRQACRHM